MRLIHGCGLYMVNNLNFEISVCGSCKIAQTEKYGINARQSGFVPCIHPAEPIILKKNTLVAMQLNWNDKTYNQDESAQKKSLCVHIEIHWKCNSKMTSIFNHLGNNT